ITQFNVVPRSSEVNDVCGAFTLPGATRATCTKFTNAAGNYACIPSTFTCVCSPSAPPEFQRIGFRSCEFDYGIFACNTNITVRPTQVNITELRKWNQYCFAQSLFPQFQYKLFDTHTLTCSFVSPQYFFTCQTDFPTLANNAAQFCLDHKGGGFWPSLSTSRLCSCQSGCPCGSNICCEMPTIAWTDEKM